MPTTNEAEKRKNKLIFAEHIQCINNVNFARDEVEHRIAAVYLAGFRNGLAAAGHVWTVPEINDYYRKYGTTRDMIAGVWTNWVPYGN